MAVLVENLLLKVLEESNKSDEIVIISGYTSPDIIEEIAKLNKKTTFYYGMYPMDGITSLTHKKLIELHNKFHNLTIKIVYDYHVHTKCYIFKKNNEITNILVGSANCSYNGLSSGKNSELLVELNSNSLSDNEYIKSLIIYSIEIDEASLSCASSLIVSKTKKTTNSKRNKNTTINPFVAIMPLYIKDKNGKKTVQKGHGINWGLANNRHKNRNAYAEANIPVRAFHIDSNPIMFPYIPEIRFTTSGKITRKFDPITVLWDDGVIMKMIFGGTGVERPSKSNRMVDEPYKCFPKQLTSEDGGGAILGEYLRKRMNIEGRKSVTYNDLKKYKKDYIELRYISPGYYEADFSGVPLNSKKK